MSCSWDFYRFRHIPKNRHPFNIFACFDTKTKSRYNYDITYQMTSIVPLKPSKSTASIFSEQEITGGKILVPVETEAQIICSMNLKKFIIISFIVTMILFTLLLSICVASITVVRKWVTKGLTLKESGGRIRQYDEALTMSAMMAASNGSSSWVDRYNSIAPLLDANIAKTLAMMPTEKSNKVQKLTEVANIKLVGMSLSIHFSA